MKRFVWLIKIEQEELQLAAGVEMENIARPEESETWRDRFDDAPALFAESDQIMKSFYIGSWVFGIWMGYRDHDKTVQSSIHRVRNEYICRS